MKTTLTRLSFAALIVGSLAGCGDGGGGGGGVAPPPSGGVTLPPALTGAATTIDYSNGATLFPTITPVITVGGAAVNSAPVVAFSIGDGNGNPYAGFQNIKRSDNNTYPNFAFSIAKLVPGANGSPSKWVSYIVMNTAGTQPQRPSTDNTGTLQYLGQGIYQYTFARDITKVKDQVHAVCIAFDPATGKCPGSGSPKEADLGDLTFDSSALHRVTIQFYGDAPGTASNTPDGTNSGITAVDMRNPVNAIYDFIPATGKAVAPTDAVTQRLIVDKLSCNECHGKLGGLPGTESESFHSGSRFDPKYCVVCHTDQRKYGRTNVTSTDFAFPVGSSTYVADGVTVGNFPVLIHRVHKGEELIKQNYNYAGVLLNETFFPQDLRNCTKCHDNTAPKVAPQAGNFQTVPSRLACGACHDGINFADGTGKTNNGKMIGHLGGAQDDDRRCAQCHFPQDIKSVFHIPVTPPNPNNSLVVAGGSAYSSAAWIASNRDNLPPGAFKVDYDIKRVYRDTNRNPVIVFRMLQTVPPSTTAVVVPFNTDTTGEMWNGFFGAPSVYFVWAVPQDGIATPADFNASASGWLKRLWNGQPSSIGTLTTLTGADAGYYAATLTGVTVPDNAVMLSGGLGYTYTLSSKNTTTGVETNGSPPLTQKGVSDPIPSNNSVPSTTPQVTPRFDFLASTVVTTVPDNLVGGLVVVTPDKQMVATGAGTITSTPPACTATTTTVCPAISTTAYSGRRPIVEDAKCNSCHQELGLFTAAEFHAGQRNDATTCGWCHTPNRTSSGWSADSSYFIHAIHAGGKREKPFTWHASAPLPNPKSFADIGYPGILSKCETCHLPGTYDFSAAASQSAMPNRLYRTAATGTFSTPDPTTLAGYSQSPYVAPGSYGSGSANTDLNLVNSPIATACFSCHDSNLAKQHMESQGASFYVQRSVALGRVELCMLCHDSDSAFGIGIKAVHNK
jgi:OmcA/MtrC family decaheme c-type cytochrome